MIISKIGDRVTMKVRVPNRALLKQGGGSVISCSHKFTVLLGTDGKGEGVARKRHE